MLYYASATAVGIMFLGCTSVGPILMNEISQERRQGISSNSTQTLTSQNILLAITQEFIHY